MHLTNSTIPTIIQIIVKKPVKMFPSEVWLAITKHLSNEELRNLQQVYPKLLDLQESKEMQSVRILVPFFRKYLPKEKTWKQLNSTLMKLFREIDKGELSEIVVICGLRADPEKEEKLIDASHHLGRKLPYVDLEYKCMGKNAWYRRVPVSEWWQVVENFGKFVKVPKEKVKDSILKRKRWIESISTKKCSKLEIRYCCVFFSIKKPLTKCF